MEKKPLKNEELETIAGGFPDGELPAGTLLCPRCGEPGDKLKLVTTGKIDLEGSQLQQLVPDNTMKVYYCPQCGFAFMVYGPFWEKRDYHPE